MAAILRGFGAAVRGGARPGAGPARAMSGAARDIMEGTQLVHSTPEKPEFRPSPNGFAVDRVSAAHWDGQWDEATLSASLRKHVVATWGPSNTLHGAPFISHGEGVYVYDSAGKKCAPLHGIASPPFPKYGHRPLPTPRVRRGAGSWTGRRWPCAPTSGIRCRTRSPTP